MAGDVRDGWPPRPPRQRPSGTTLPHALTTLLYMNLIAMSSANLVMARNFETETHANNQGPATANTYDPYHHNLASDSVVWAHPVFRAWRQRHTAGNGQWVRVTVVSRLRRRLCTGIQQRDRLRVCAAAAAAAAAAQQLRHQGVCVETAPHGAQDV